MTFQLSPESVHTIGWALLHFVWQGALVAVFLPLVLAACRRASVRYALSVGALLLLLSLPVITFLALREPQPQFTAAFEETTQPAPIKSASPGPLTHHAYVAPQPEESRPEAMLWLVRLWLAGVALFSLRCAGGFLLVQRLRKIATVPASGELLRLCIAVQRRMGIARAVKFCRSAALQVPAVVGGIRPIVLLPITALTGLTDSQIEAIIAHELAHIQRLDYFVNLFQVFAETVLFYHPAVWWVNQRIRIERENCCDDTAIAVCGNRLEYVRALTHLERARLTPQFAMAANGSPLKARVRRLLGMTEEREEVRRGSSLLGGAVIAVIILAASSLVSGAKAQADKPVTAPPPPAVQSEPAEPPAQAAPAPPTQPQGPAVSPAAPDATQAPKPAAAAPIEPKTPDVISRPTSALRFSVPPIQVHVPPVNVSVPAVHVNVPPVNVSVPAVHVNVPAMNVSVPAVHVNTAAMHFAIPPMEVHVPKLDLNMPAIHIHPMMLQAGTEPSAQNAPSESYIDGMKAAGYGDLSIDELVAMKIQDITPEYVKGMRALGLKIDADELVAMKIQGVTPDYVKEMREAYPGINVDTLIGFKIQNVSPQYVKEMRVAYPGIDADATMGLKVQNVTPEYVAEFTKLGVKADPDEIMGLKVQGVTAEYVRDMRATGIHFDTDALIGMKVQGVTPAYVSALKSAGITKLDADEIIGAKVMGITPEFIEKARSHGFKDLSLDKLIGLKNSGVL